MESSSKVVILALIVVASAAVATSAKAKGNNDGTICGVTQSELFECKPAVAANTPAPPKPTTLCCDSLKHANLTCFCSFKNSMLLPALGIDVTRAMQLPSQCDPTQTATCT